MTTFYKEKTYDNIKARVLRNINTDLDKREGSFINDMVSPYCLELENFYAEFPYLLGTMFLVDADSEELEKRAAEYGLYRKQSLQSLGYIYITPKSLPFTIKKGTIVTTLTNILFTIEEDKIFTDLNEVKLQIKALNAGAIGNVSENTIVKFVDNINASIVNKEKTNGGADRETDNELLSRILFKLQNPSMGGNIADYKMWTLEVAGVGDCKIYPTAYGNGTVKVLAISNTKTPLDNVIIQNIKDNIESKKPIFGKVYVETPSLLLINIDAKIVIEQVYSLEIIKADFIKKLTDYINNIIFRRNSVDYYNILSFFYSINGVSQVIDFKINGEAKNIIITDNQVPKIDTTNIVI